MNDLDAWARLKAKIGDGRKQIVVVGAGMVGCELADDFTAAGHQVTLLDVQQAPLAALLPAQASERLRAALECAGVTFVGRAQVSEVVQNASGKKTVITACGLSLECDEVVAATGLSTDTRLAAAAKLVLERGIVVDPTTLQTSATDVYALGDCVSIDGMPCRFIEPIAKQAQAIAAALGGAARDALPPHPAGDSLKDPLLARGDAWNPRCAGAVARGLRDGKTAKNGATGSGR